MYDAKLAILKVFEIIIHNTTIGKWIYSPSVTKTFHWYVANLDFRLKSLPQGTFTKALWFAYIALQFNQDASAKTPCPCLLDHSLTHTCVMQQGLYTHILSSQNYKNINMNLKLKRVIFKANKLGWLWGRSCTCEQELLKMSNTE